MENDLYNIALHVVLFLTVFAWLLQVYEFAMSIKHCFGFKGYWSFFFAALGQFLEATARTILIVAIVALLVLLEVRI